MGVLGETLQQMRRSRGLSLEEAERDTHISRHYLEALEAEDFSALPAPVFGKGFLRIYAQYLGLNPQDLLNLYPSSPREELYLHPLPDLEQPSLRPFNWLIAGTVSAVLFLVVVLLYWSGGNSSPPPTALTAPAPETTSAPLAAMGGCLGTIAPNTVPDFRGCTLDVAYGVLRETGIPYIVIEAATDEVPAGIVYQQSPQPATPLEPTTTITLVVSKNPQ